MGGLCWHSEVMLWWHGMQNPSAHHTDPIKSLQLTKHTVYNASHTGWIILQLPAYYYSTANLMTCHHHCLWRSCQTRITGDRCVTQVYRQLLILTLVNKDVKYVFQKTEKSSKPQQVFSVSEFGNGQSKNTALLCSFQHQLFNTSSDQCRAIILSQRCSEADVVWNQLCDFKPRETTNELKHATV